MAKPLKPKTKEVTKVTTQSYMITSAKFKYTLAEERIKNAIIDNLWELTGTGEISGKKLSNCLFKLHKGYGSNIYEVAIPIAPILEVMKKEETDENKNYQYIIDAAESMMTKIFSVRNEKGDYWGAPLISNVHSDRGSGILHFWIADWVVTALLDLRKGYTQFELDKMQSLRSPYSMRMYEMISNCKKNELTFLPKQLREWFGLEETAYPREFDFEKRVLKPAKKELDKTCPWSFDYVAEKPLNKNGNPIKNKPVRKYHIFPKYIAKNDNNKDKERRKAVAKLPATGRFGALRQELQDYLLKNLGWSQKSIQANVQTLAEAQELLPDILSDLSYMSAMARKSAADRPVGYVIQSLKNKIEEVKKGKSRSLAEAIAKGFSVK